MSASDRYDFVIVGAGPTGLVLSQQLLASGKSVLLIERYQRPGGLARSYTFGENIFDLGPKRFHTDDSIVNSYINSVMELDEIGRSTLVCFFNEYLQWPLRKRDVLLLPPGLAIKSCLDLFNRNPSKDKSSFKEFIISRYGSSLFESFFKPYTEKFLRWDIDDIHSDWASTGINRAVVDEDSNKIASSSFALLKNLALPQKVDAVFQYPSAGGFGEFFDMVHRVCMSNPNFTSLFGTTVSSVSTAGPDSPLHVTVNGTIYETGKLIWTGNLNNLADLVSDTSSCNTEKPSAMRYLNTRFHYFTVKEEHSTSKKAQWIYVSDKKLMSSRITNMKEFSKGTCKKGYYNFIVEATDSQLKDKSYLPTSHTQSALQVMNELEQIQYIKSASLIEDFHVVDVEDTYPIYTRGYKADFAKNTQYIKQYSKNIMLLGRTGSFWYNNSDHSVRQALDAAKYLTGEATALLDYRHYFGGEAND